MATDVLQREISELPDSDIKLLVEFVRFLKYERGRMASYEEEPSGVQGARKRRRGFLADAFVSISPDFDETSEGMEEYF